MSLGEKLKTARLAGKMTASEVAASTRMKIQIVEALEREDFAQMAAPIYAKGFIRMYAEHVGLDPKPLIDEYLTRFVPQKTPSLVSEASPSDVEHGPEEEAAAEEREVRNQDPDLFSPEPDSAGPDVEEKAKLRWPTYDFAPLRALMGKLEDFLVRFCRTASSRFEAALKDVRSAAERRRFAVPKIRPADLPFRSVSVMIGVVVILIFVISGLSRCVRRLRHDMPLPDDAIQEQLRLAVEPPEPYLE